METSEHTLTITSTSWEPGAVVGEGAVGVGGFGRKDQSGQTGVKRGTCGLELPGRHPSLPKVVMVRPSPG